MRKPNLAEAVEHYVAIMNAFKREGNQHYAVFCCLAVARCEQAMNSGSSQEAGFYVEAGSMLWDISKEDFTISYLGYDEDITEAINCYLLAIKIYTTQNRLGMAAQLYAEIGHTLYVLERYTLAAEYLSQAAILRQKEAPLTAASLWLKASHYYVVTGADYKPATDCLTSVIKVLFESDPSSSPPPHLPHTPSGLATTAAAAATSSSTTTQPTTAPLASPVRACLMAEARISLILLYLLQDSFLSAKDHIDKLVLDNPLGPDASDDVVSLLQTLVKACERRQVAGLQAIQRELWYTLNQSQNELLQRLICAYQILL